MLNPDPTQAPPLRAFVRDRTKILFAGEAEAITSFNEKGEFDILAFHENFISLISKELRIRIKGGTVQTIPVASGVATVKQNVVEVYLGILH